MPERDLPVRMSEELCRTLTERLAENHIENEYGDLRAFRESAFAEAVNDAEAGHPAVDDRYGSHCRTVVHDELRRAYDRAGLAW